MACTDGSLATESSTQAHQPTESRFTSHRVPLLTKDMQHFQNNKLGNDRGHNSITKPKQCNDRGHTKE